MNFELNNRIKILNKYSNIDVLYGPYASINDACKSVPEGIRDIGLTVGVIVNGSVQEYQWKSGTTDNDLVEKVESVELTLSRIGERSITVHEGDLIPFQFNVSGRAIISKCSVYRYINGSEIFVTSFTNIAKGANTIQVQSPDTSGIYTYRLKVIDSTGYTALAEGTQDDFIEYEVKYGGVSVSINTTTFDKIKIKNVISVANQHFTANISVRDDSFSIVGMYFYASDGTQILLNPYKSLTEQNDTYIGFNYYTLPDQEGLSDFDGKECYIKIVYTNEGTQIETYKELFTLLKIDSLTFVSQTAVKDYYVNFPVYYTFQLHSGIENLSVYIQQNEDSDFRFDTVTVNSYNNYSLRIIPTAVKTDAYLSLKCSYTISNVSYIKNFKVLIGEIKNIPEKAYYEPSISSSTSLYKMVDAGENDLTEGTFYYKIINDTQTSEDLVTCAFIADLHCKINQTGNKNTKYVKILQGSTEIGFITEDIINCNGIITDTPINEWAQISLGYNIEESVDRSGDIHTSEYFAIYINGMVVKNTKIGTGSMNKIEYNPQRPIKIELSDGILVRKCFVYYNNNGQDFINPNAATYSIVYTNFLAANLDFDEPADLPVLKLMRITDESLRRQYFDAIKEKTKI